MPDRRDELPEVGLPVPLEALTAFGLERWRSARGRCAGVVLRRLAWLVDQADS